MQLRPLSREPGFGAGEVRTAESSLQNGPGCMFKVWKARWGLANVVGQPRFGNDV
jgi:hypothetical protein